MSLMAVTTLSALLAAQFATSSSALMTGLTASATALNALPTAVPKSLASFPCVASSANLAMIRPIAVTTSRTSPTTMLRISIHASNAPVAANACTNRPTALIASPMIASRFEMPLIAMVMALAIAHVNRSNTSDGMRFFQSTDWNAFTTPAQASWSFWKLPVLSTSLYRLMSQFLATVTAAAAASPILPNCDENALMAPLMLETPTASMTFCTAFEIRLCTFSIAVPMPWVASLACCAKLAYWPKPFLSRSTIALLKSSKETVPFFMASYKSFPFFPAPSSASATWLSCPGIAAWMERHACMSTVPALNICVYWVSAFSCSMVDAPPASMASFSARLIVVASSRLEVNGASCWTMPLMTALDVGRPSNALPIFLMLFDASSDE